MTRRPVSRTDFAQPWHFLLAAGLRHWTTRVKRTTADRKSTRLNSSHGYISYAVFCLKKKKKKKDISQRNRKKERASKKNRRNSSGVPATTYADQQTLQETNAILGGTSDVRMDLRDT